MVNHNSCAGDRDSLLGTMDSKIKAALTSSDTENLYRKRVFISLPEHSLCVQEQPSPRHIHMIFHRVDPDIIMMARFAATRFRSVYQKVFFFCWAFSTAGVNGKYRREFLWWHTCDADLIFHVDREHFFYFNWKFLMCCLLHSRCARFGSSTAPWCRFPQSHPYGVCMNIQSCVICCHLPDEEGEREILPRCVHRTGVTSINLCYLKLPERNVKSCVRKRESYTKLIAYISPITSLGDRSISIFLSFFFSLIKLETLLSFNSNGF